MLRNTREMIARLTQFVLPNAQVGCTYVKFENSMGLAAQTSVNMYTKRCRALLQYNMPGGDTKRTGVFSCVRNSSKVYSLEVSTWCRICATSFPAASLLGILRRTRGRSCSKSSQAIWSIKFTKMKRFGGGSLREPSSPGQTWLLLPPPSLVDEIAALSPLSHPGPRCHRVDHTESLSPS